MDIEEYKAKLTEKITCPSGLEVQTKNISPYTLLKIQEELGISSDSDNTYSAKVVEKLFERFIREPELHKELELEDLTKEDYIYLHDLIFKKITFPEEKEGEE